MVVAPLLFQTAFNYASNPPVSGRSPRLCGLAPMGSRRFTKSSGTSPPGGSSFDRVCVVSGPLPQLSPYRLTPIHLALGGGNFLSWHMPTVGRPPSPNVQPICFSRYKSLVWSIVEQNNCLGLRITHSCVLDVDFSIVIDFQIIPRSVRGHDVIPEWRCFGISHDVLWGLPQNNFRSV